MLQQKLLVHYKSHTCFHYSCWNILDFYLNEYGRNDYWKEVQSQIIANIFFFQDFMKSAWVLQCMITYWWTFFTAIQIPVNNFFQFHSFGHYLYTLLDSSHVFLCSLVSLKHWHCFLLHSSSLLQSFDIIIINENFFW